MPVILFDHQKFTTQRYGGISRYFANMVKYIRFTEDFDCLSGVLYTENQYLTRKKFPFNNRLAKRFFATPFGQKQLYKLNQQYCIRLLKKGKFDLFHPTYYDTYFLPFLKGKPLITTIHDMTYERLPEYFWSQDPLPLQKRTHIEKADAIIAISETTKNDILEFFPQTDPNKIKVIYHGIEARQSTPVDAPQWLPPNYLLYVGDRGGYKNFHLLLKVFGRLVNLYPELKLVITGGGQPGIAELEAMKRIKVHDKIIHRDVSDAELFTLYQNALVFVYPSLYEGFGLPILEAFQAGCPVLLSDIRCFREVGADAAVFFEARNPDALFYSLKELIEKEDLRKTLQQKGYKRLKDFPVQRQMEDTLQLYRSLLFR